MKKTALIVLAYMLTGGMFFAQELALVRDNDKFGYIDTTGKFAINPQFEKASSFSDGLAGAMKNGKWGFVDTTGNFVIEATYDRVKYFKSGYALVLKDKQWNYIGKNGQVLQTPVKEKYYDFDENGLAFYKVEKQFGLINTTGKVVLEPTYDAIKPFVNGYARVKKNDKWGMIDTTGNVFIALDYDEIGDYSSNGVSVRKGDSFGFHVNGKMNTIQGADKVWDFPKGEKLTYARKEKMIGFVNNQGDWIIAPTFYKARAFSNGLAPVFNDDNWGYIDKTGKEVIPFQYRDAETFAENGLAPVKEKKLWGFIDKTGKLVIPMEYIISVGGFGIFSRNNLKGFHNGLARVRYEKEWGFIDKTGKPLGGKWYENAEVFSK